MFDRFHRSDREKVDVGDQRLVEARRAKLPVDVLECDRRGLVRGRDADDLAARFREADRLGDRRRNVLRVGGRHRLQAERIRPTHGHATYVHDAGEAADRAVAGGTVVRGHGGISTPLPSAVNERQKSQRQVEGIHW